MRVFDGAKCWTGIAACSLGGWLLALPSIGFWPAGLFTLAAILIVLRYLLHYYNQLEQRDLDDRRRSKP